MKSKLIFYIKFIFSLFLGIFATGFNIHAANTARAEDIVTMHLVFFNTLSGLGVAILTGIYLYYQIIKIKKELKKKKDD